jgi:ParB family chromosome partitioning protein
MKLTDNPSPILGVTGAMIADESTHLIADDDQFAHSFTVSVSAIEADPEQPRRHFDQASLQDMAESFKTVGLLQPLLLRKHPRIRRRWIIVAGERRWRAAKLAGWTEVTAIETTANTAQATLIENIQRRDLTVMEEGRALQKMMQTHFWTQERCATALGIDASRVSSALNVLNLPSEFLAEVTSGAVNVPRNLLVELSRIKNVPLRDRMIALAREGDLTIRMLRTGRKAAEGQEETPAQEKVERDEAEPTGLKSARLKQLLATLNAVSAGAYQPSAAELEKLIAIRTVIDRIIAVHADELSKEIN